jgi:ATP-binding cassette subfamily B protein
MALMFPTMMLVVNASSIAVIWFGGHRINSGAMSIGSLVAFLTYLSLIMMAVMMATMVDDGSPCGRLRRTHPGSSTRRRCRPPHPSRTWSREAASTCATLAFATWQEHAVLEGISVHGAGPDDGDHREYGSGRASNLAARLFDVTAGAVLFDGGISANLT